VSIFFNGVVALPRALLHRLSVKIFTPKALFCRRSPCSTLGKGKQRAEPSAKVASRVVCKGNYGILADFFIIFFGYLFI